MDWFVGNMNFVRVATAIFLVTVFTCFGNAEQQTFDYSEYLPEKANEFIDIDWQPGVLGPGFRPNKTYRFTTKTELQISSYDSLDRIVTIQQQMRFDTEPRATKTSGVAVKAMTERLRFSVSNDEDSVKYDSLNNQQSKLGQHFQSTLRRHVLMELNDDFQVLSQREVGEQTEEKALEGLPRIGPDELTQVIRLMPQAFSNDPVAIGQSWNKAGKQQIGELGELDFQLTYKLTGFVKHRKTTCAVIEFHGQMSGDIISEDQSHLDFQSAQLHGRILFDPVLRVIRHSESTITMVANMPSPDDPNINNPISVQQNTILEFMSVK